MKPICITMQEFGVYKDKKIIDFASIKDNNIFLITGPTGSGKTTILDAICFALYCRATGGLRKWNNMRNIAAQADKPTFVEYIFSLGDKKYKFKRTLKVHHVRGTDRQELRDEHSCFSEEDKQWVLLASGSEAKVREYAESLIGLDCEQFSKVIVLPQGEFRKLILSSSDEKVKIFQKLFMTQKWNKIMDAAFSLVKNAKQELDGITTEKNAILSSQNAASPEELLESCEYLKDEISKNKKETKTLEKQRDQFLVIIQKLNLIIISNQKLFSLNEKVTDASSQLEIVELNFSKVKKEKEQLPIIDLENKELSNRLNDLSLLLQTIDEIKKLQNEKIAVQEKLELSINKKNNLEKDLNEVLVNIEKGEKYSDDLLNIIENLPSLLLEKEKLLYIDNSYSLLSEKALKYKKAEDNYNKTLDLFNETSDKVESIRLDLGVLTNELESNIIATLSLGLKDNTPCPICGSSTHPNPASSNSNYDTSNSDRIQVLKRTLSVEEKNQNTLNLNLNKSLAVFENLKDEYQKQKNLCTDFNINQKENTCKIDELNDKIKNSDIAKNMFLKAKEHLSYRKNQEKELLKNIENCIVSITELEQTLKFNIRQEEKFNNELIKKCGSHPNIEKEILDITIKINSNILKINEINSLYSKSTGERERVKANLKNLTDQLKDEKLNNDSLTSSFKESAHSIDIFKQKYSETELNIKDNNKKSGNLDQKLISLNEAIEKVDKIEKKSKKLQENYSRLAKISSLMGGNNECKVPIKMFVLGLIFDDVLSFANIYFSQLSLGRYSLSRVTDKIVSRGYNGLSIEIFDAYCGGVRAVNTLSGGELFLASLSLAFGLSDAVQSYSGGIRFDSIFIDEGFGSLDPSTLNTAMSALNQIQQTGRIIGIISHVHELRTLIPAKIEL